MGNGSVLSSCFMHRVVGGALVMTMIAVLWRVILFAKAYFGSKVNCGNCKFSDVIHDSKEMKCQLTGYNYPITYSCKASKPKEVEGAKDSKTSNR